MAIKFKLNQRKAIEAVLWLMQRGASNMYHIVKMLFEAEKYHLNKYERPITGDSYVALELGTVPEWLYFTAFEQLNMDFVKNGYYLHAKRPPITDMLSESDIEALELGYEKYAGLSFRGVKDLNHKEPAWQSAWKSRGALKRADIPFEDLVEDDLLRDDLKETARLTVI